MGFSVTAASAILFIAALTAGSAAMNAWIDSTAATTTARNEWQRAAASQLDTDLVLSVATCSGGCTTPTVPIVRIDIQNAGTTVVEYLNFTLVIDGIVHQLGNFTNAEIVSPASVTGTHLVLPGETMRIELQDVPVTAAYTTATLPVRVITLDGVVGTR